MENLGFPKKCPSRSFRGWDQQWCTVARQAARTQAAGREPHFDQVHWSQVGYVFGGFLSPKMIEQLNSLEFYVHLSRTSLFYLLEGAGFIRCIFVLGVSELGDIHKIAVYSKRDNLC